MSEYINHFHTVRLRATGFGSLQLRLLSLDEVDSSTLVALTLAATSARFLNRLSNFKSSKASLELKTTEINENFVIKEIIIYSKPVESEFPG